MKPPIPIPFSPRRDVNHDRYGDALGDPCLLCAKPIKDAAKARVVVLAGDCGKIADPMTPAASNGGEFLIGPDCWRKNPQLHPYEIKVGEPSYRDL